MLGRKSMAPKKLAFVIGALCAHTFAQAQDAEPIKLEEIIVTSQKIAESLQDVPISVTTLTGEKLEDAGIENLEDLTAYLPNIHFTESGISTQVRVRGIGSDNSQGFEQSVGMYIDGIYYGRAQLFRTPMMDMQRAELLRGPQSTLFGKNSISGALNLTTAQPTEEFEGSLSVSHEFEHNQDEVNAVISGPITDDLRARIAVRHYEEEGYYYNSFTEKDNGEVEEQAARITLDWTPTENLQFILKAEQNEFETLGRAIEITQDEADGGNYNQWLILLSESEIDPELDYRRQVDANEFSDNEITNLTLTTNYQFGDYTLTSVTGQLEYNYDELCDCDFVAAEIINVDLYEDYEQFSQEIRIASPLGETFEWIAGVYYQDYDQVFYDDLIFTQSNTLLNLPGLGGLANTASSRDFVQSSEAWAVFGQVTWNVSDKLAVTLGARYTEEDKSATKELSIYNALTGETINGNTQEGSILGWTYWQAFLFESEQLTVDYSLNDDGTPASTFGQPLQNSGYNVSGQRDESAFTPLVNIEYNFTDDLMAYATFTKGFKAGGFDPRSNTLGELPSAEARSEPNPTKNFEFEEEEATAYELGFKSSLAEGRGEINVALYRTDYDDLQISQFDGGVGFNVGNAKETRVQGVEFDGRWLLADGLTANYGISYLDFEYLDFENGNCNFTNRLDASQGTADLDGDGDFELCSYTGKRGVYTPEYTVNLGLDYLTPINDWLDFVGFIDVQYVDEQQVHVNLDPNGMIDAYTIVNLRLGVEAKNWSIGVLGKNISDEEVISYSANAPLSDSQFGTNTHYSFVRRPMTVALEAKLKF